jgi:hypothetical protein
MSDASCVPHARSLRALRRASGRDITSCAAAPTRRARPRDPGIGRSGTRDLQPAPRALPFASPRVALGLFGRHPPGSQLVVVLEPCRRGARILRGPVMVVNLPSNGMCCQLTHRPAWRGQAPQSRRAIWWIPADELSTISTAPTELSPSRAMRQDDILGGCRAKTSSRRSYEPHALFDPAPDHTSRILLAGWRWAEQAVIKAELAAGTAGSTRQASARKTADEALRALRVAENRYRQYMDDLNA